jgi:hypothetical protein
MATVYPSTIRYFVFSLKALQEKTVIPNIFKSYFIAKGKTSTEYLQYGVLWIYHDIIFSLKMTHPDVELDENKNTFYNMFRQLTSIDEGMLEIEKRYFQALEKNATPSEKDVDIVEFARKHFSNCHVDLNTPGWIFAPDMAKTLTSLATAQINIKILFPNQEQVHQKIRTGFAKLEPLLKRVQDLYEWVMLEKITGCSVPLGSLKTYLNSTDPAIDDTLSNWLQKLEKSLTDYNLFYSITKKIAEKLHKHWETLLNFFETKAPGLYLVIKWREVIGLDFPLSSLEKGLNKHHIKKELIKDVQHLDMQACYSAPHIFDPVLDPWCQALEAKIKRIDEINSFYTLLLQLIEKTAQKKYGIEHLIRIIEQSSPTVGFWLTWRDKTGLEIPFESFSTYFNSPSNEIPSPLMTWCEELNRKKNIDVYDFFQFCHQVLKKLNKKEDQIVWFTHRFNTDAPEILNWSSDKYTQTLANHFECNTTEFGNGLNERTKGGATFSFHATNPFFVFLQNSDEGGCEYFPQATNINYQLGITQLPVITGDEISDIQLSELLTKEKTQNRWFIGLKREMIKVVDKKILFTAPVGITTFSLEEASKFIRESFKNPKPYLHRLGLNSNHPDAHEYKKSLGNLNSPPTSPLKKVNSFIFETKELIKKAHQTLQNIYTNVPSIETLQAGAQVDIFEIMFKTNKVGQTPELSEYIEEIVKKHKLDLLDSRKQIIDVKENETLEQFTQRMNQEHQWFKASAIEEFYYSKAQ